MNEKILDDAADKIAEEINSEEPDISKCFSIGLEAMKNYNFELQRQQNIEKFEIRRLKK
jgi:hypothetical protein